MVSGNYESSLSYEWAEPSSTGRMTNDDPPAPYYAGRLNPDDEADTNWPAFRLTQYQGRDTGDVVISVTVTAPQECWYPLQRMGFALGWITTHANSRAAASG